MAFKGPGYHELMRIFGELKRKALGVENRAKPKPFSF